MGRSGYRRSSIGVSFYRGLILQRICLYPSLSGYDAIELDRFNYNPFQKKEGRRISVFESLEKHLLKPLPKVPYEVASRRKAKVQSNSHISVQKCYHSVPYQTIGQEMKVKIGVEFLDIYDENTHLCTHLLFKDRIGAYSTDITHLPAQSAQYDEWNSTRYLNWAKKKGPFTE